LTDDIFKKAKEGLRPTIQNVRKQSIWSPEGRMFLDAAASAAGYKADDAGNLIDESGRALPKEHADYQWVKSMAERQAAVESPIGRELLE
jgi:hypothetical protein